jgi:hypothetical protein
MVGDDKTSHVLSLQGDNHVRFTAIKTSTLPYAGNTSARNHASPGRFDLRPTPGIQKLPYAKPPVEDP